MLAMHASRLLHVAQANSFSVESRAREARWETGGVRETSAMCVLRANISLAAGDNVNMWRELFSKQQAEREAKQDKHHIRLSVYGAMRKAGRVTQMMGGKLSHPVQTMRWVAGGDSLQK